MLAAQQAEEIMVSKQLLDSLELVSHALHNWSYAQTLPYFRWVHFREIALHTREYLVVEPPLSSIPCAVSAKPIPAAAVVRRRNDRIRRPLMAAVVKESRKEAEQTRVLFGGLLKIPTPQVERSLFQNFLHSKQLEYRNYPPVEIPPEESLFSGLGGGPSGGGGGSIGGGSENRRSDAWENMSTSTKVGCGLSWWEHALAQG